MNINNMNADNFSFEKANKKKGMRISLFTHAGLLFCAMWFYMSHDPSENIDTQYAVEVEFIEFKESSLSKYTKDDEGDTRPKEEVKKIEVTPKKTEVEVKVKTQPVELPKTKTEIEPQPTDPVVTDVVVEEAEIEAIEEDLEMEDAEFEEIPEPVEDPVVEPVEEEGSEEPAVEAEVPSSNDMEADDEGGNPSVFEGEGGGAGKGSKGDGKGKTKGDDGDEGMGDGGSGSGMYDGSGHGIFGRKVIYKNTGAVLKEMTGSAKLAFKICVNRLGIVQTVEIIWDETTLTNRKQLKEMAKAAKGYKFEPDFSAPKEQCGRLYFNIDQSDINKLNGG